jgi:hypothetical protein
VVSVRETARIRILLSPLGCAVFDIEPLPPDHPFREEDLSLRLGEIAEQIRVPAHIAARIEQTLKAEENSTRERWAEESKRLENRLKAIQRRMDQAYDDRLAGHMPEDVWKRKMNLWQEAGRRDLNPRPSGPKEDFRSLDEFASTRICDGFMGNARRQSNRHKHVETGTRYIRRYRLTWIVSVIPVPGSNWDRDRTRSLWLLFLSWSSPNPFGAVRHPG